MIPEGYFVLQCQLHKLLLNFDPQNLPGIQGPFSWMKASLSFYFPLHLSNQKVEKEWAKANIADLVTPIPKITCQSP